MAGKQCTPARIQLQLIVLMQTWVLLRLMYYGFKGLCDSFTRQHGQYYVVPVRINGSVIGSLFSRFKYDAGGNLSATNYESAISRLLTADAVSEGKREESAYRKDNLSVTCGLNRKSK